MKIRLKTNSFCIRLSSEEVNTLLREGTLSEEFPLGENGIFNLDLSLNEDTRFFYEKSSDRLLLEIPKQSLAQWMNSSQIIGLKAEIGSSQGKDFQLIIEKDVKEGKKEKLPTPDHAYLSLN